VQDRTKALTGAAMAMALAGARGDTEREMAGCSAIARSSRRGGEMSAGLSGFIASHGVWVVAGFIAFESVGAPLPAEAFLIAAAIFAATTHELDIRLLVSASILAAILGNVAGFWIGRRYGHALLMKHGYRIGLTASRIKIGQWLFQRYGGVFVFAARFLPFLRNMAAVLAGANCMAPHKFYFASSIAAAAWVMAYAFGAYSFGEAFTNSASPALVVTGLAAALVIVGLPMLIVRWEKRLLARAEHENQPPSQA
jgi:membrane protein DedA with SNARE-associated domain